MKINWSSSHFESFIRFAIVPSSSIVSASASPASAASRIVVVSLVEPGPLLKTAFLLVLTIGFLLRLLLLGLVEESVLQLHALLQLDE